MSCFFVFLLSVGEIKTFRSFCCILFHQKYKFQTCRNPLLQDFAILKNGKVQKRGKVNMIGRLQLSTEKAREEENEGIVQLRIFRVQG